MRVVVHFNWHPHLRVKGKIEAARHHSDYNSALAIHGDGAPQHFAVGAEAVAPQLFAHHHDVIAARQVFIRHKAPTPGWVDAQYREKLRSNVGDGESHCIASAGYRALRGVERGKPVIQAGFATKLEV